MGRTFAIADVHGRYDLLVSAFEKIVDQVGENVQDARVVVLGDFIDRGPNSNLTVSFLKLFQEKVGDRLIVLQGNHEAMMIESCSGRSKMLWWMRNGGDATLMSYGYEYGDRLRPSEEPLAGHLEWLAGLPTAHEDEYRIYVHAGLPSSLPLEETDAEIRQWMIYGSGGAKGGRPTFPDGPHCSGKHIVHGHDQSEDNPFMLSHRTNLDSWAHRTGALAIGVFDDHQPGGPIDIIWAKEESLCSN